MNEFIVNELHKVKNIDLSYVTLDTKEINIDKVTEVKVELQKDHYYLVKVEKYIINPPSNFTLHSNWNNGIIPKDEYMKIDVLQLMGKMVKINSIGYDIENNTDTGNHWEGWLPISSITILKEI